MNSSTRSCHPLSPGQQDKASAKAEIEAAIGKFHTWHEVIRERVRSMPGSRHPNEMPTE